MLLHDPPPEAVLPLLVLELPQVPRKSRVDPLLPVSEGGSVVVVPEFERWLGIYNISELNPRQLASRVYYKLVSYSFEAAIIR